MTLQRLFFWRHDSHDGALFSMRPGLLNRQASITAQESICMPTQPDALLRADQSVCLNGRVAGPAARSLSRDWILWPHIKRRGGVKLLKQIALLPVAIHPPRNNARIALQGGMFTLHGGTVPSLAHAADFGESVPLETLRIAGAPLISKFAIPKNRKRQIRTDLGRLGIHHASLFRNSRRRRSTFDVSGRANEPPGRPLTPLSSRNMVTNQAGRIGYTWCLFPAARTWSWCIDRDAARSGSTWFESHDKPCLHATRCSIA